MWTGVFKVPSALKSLRFTIPTQSNFISTTTVKCHQDKRPWYDPENSDKFSELNRLREAYPRISQIQGNLSDFWKSSSFPVEPEYILKNDLLTELLRLSTELFPLLESVIPEYPDDVKEVASGSPSPEEGKCFDVVELLSRFPGDLIRNNGDRVALKPPDAFKGKYVLICCFHMPFLINYRYNDFWSLINLCNELYSTRNDFEMVMVARMSRLANDKAIFDHFFSGFPESCLAVPFEDNQRRDYMVTTHMVTYNANYRKHDPASQHFPLVDTLYCDVEEILGYDEFRDHEMESFANPGAYYPEFVKSESS